jgi:branched-chain amino acid aminotransferase
MWVNGRLAGAEDPAAGLSPFDHGVLVGDGVFETMKVVDGRPFAMRRHLARLARSAAGLGLAPPDETELRRAVADVLTANGPGVGRVRMTLTSGPGPLGSARGDAKDGTVTVLTGPPAAWEESAAVAIAPWPRNERGATAGLKTTSYAENAIALAWAVERGASEAIFANTTGALCEGTGSNVFVSFDGRLVTPPLSAGCLAGVTRELLLEAGVGEELDVPIGALTSAPEAFLASSTRDVQPIVTVDGARLAAAPGPLTRAAADTWAALVEADFDP